MMAWQRIDTEDEMGRRSYWMDPATYQTRDTNPIWEENPGLADIIKVVDAEFDGIEGSRYKGKSLQSIAGYSPDAYKVRQGANKASTNPQYMGEVSDTKEVFNPKTGVWENGWQIPGELVGQAGAIFVPESIAKQIPGATEFFDSPSRKTIDNRAQNMEYLKIVATLAPFLGGVSGALGAAAGAGGAGAGLGAAGAEELAMLAAMQGAGTAGLGGAAAGLGAAGAGELASLAAMEGAGTAGLGSTGLAGLAGIDPAAMSLMGELGGGSAVGSGLSQLAAGAAGGVAAGGAGSDAAASSLMGELGGGSAVGSGLTQGATGAGLSVADQALLNGDIAATGGTVGANTVGAAGTAAQTAAKTALQKIFDGTAGPADYAELLGKAAPGLISAYGSSQQANSQEALAREMLGLGAPARGRFEASMQPGFDPYTSIAGYKGAVDTSMESMLRKLSAQGGNPFGNPGGLIEAQKSVINGTAMPAINEYQRLNAGAGGLASLSASYPSAASGANNANGEIWSDLGSAFKSVFSPQAGLDSLLKQYGYSKSAALP